VSPPSLLARLVSVTVFCLYLALFPHLPPLFCFFGWLMMCSFQIFAWKKREGSPLLPDWWPKTGASRAKLFPTFLPRRCPRCHARIWNPFATGVNLSECSSCHCQFQYIPFYRNLYFTALPLITIALIVVAWHGWRRDSPYIWGTFLGLGLVGGTLPIEELESNELKS
jgi:hypothetical protein